MCYTNACEFLSLPAGLNINFEESDHSIFEGTFVPSTNLTLTFRNNQNPFNVTLTPSIIGEAESLGLGDFINSDNIGPTFRATAGTDF